MRGNRRVYRRKYRPFWLPASNFYFLSVAIAIGVFFLLWAILNDAREDSPWITAGLVASFVLIGAVVLRELILRNMRQNLITAQKRLDSSVMALPVRHRKESENKLTVEKNALLLDEIRRKSDAANVLSTLSASHREVFELCEAYLEAVRHELPLIGVGSPRIAPITRGRDKVEAIHRSHMLKWAEIEAMTNMQSAGVAEENSDRLGRAKNALNVVEKALAFYPDERNLNDSAIVLEELISSIRVSGLVERAENAADKGNYHRAVGIYKEALEVLEGEIGSEKNDEMADRIRFEVERLRNSIVT